MRLHGRKDHNYVWLLTEREFADFELRLKFQAYRDSPGNSGLQFRSRFDAAANGGWLDGPQVDIHPPESMSWRTGLIYDETREEKRWISPSLKNATMDPRFQPASYVFKYADDGDGWNDLVLLCRGTHVKTILNGVVRTDWDVPGSWTTPATSDTTWAGWAISRCNSTPAINCGSGSGTSESEDSDLRWDSGDDLLHSPGGEFRGHLRIEYGVPRFPIHHDGHNHTTSVIIHRFYQRTRTQGVAKETINSQSSIINPGTCFLSSRVAPAIILPGSRPGSTCDEGVRARGWWYGCGVA